MKSRNDWTKEEIAQAINDIKATGLKFIDSKKPSLNKFNKQLYIDINKTYPNLFSSYQELYYSCKESVLSDIRFCPICGTRVKFNTYYKYRLTCSTSCKTKYQYKFQGCVNPSNRPEVVAKRTKTFIDRYGVSNPSQLKEVKEKKVATCKIHFGVDHPGQVESGKIKSKQTKFTKYGNENFTNRAKALVTCKDKYNVDNPKQTHLLNFDKLNEAYWREHFIKDGYFLTYECASFHNITYSALLKKKKLFNIAETTKIHVGKTQAEIYDFVKQYEPNVLLNDKIVLDNKELDIYLPSKKIAIEYDGLMFHSFGKSEHTMFNNYADEKSNIHLEKTQLCAEKGITLLHIFENEWLDVNKQAIWKSIILNKLGKSSRLYARKCEIREVSTQTDFLNKNHLQGYCPSKINIGLYYNNELVSLMTFGKPRFNKKYEWELLRFCNKINTTVIGSASKLFTYFQKQYASKVVSYANRRFSQGSLYNILGFKKYTETTPNYFYFTETDRLLLSRLQYQKHKLKSKLDKFDSTLTESANMYNNGFRKIYDCGNITYVT
jgi:hypothetical protein